MLGFSRAKPDGEQEGHGPLTSVSERNKVQQFQFQTQRTSLFMGAQKLYLLKI